MYTYMCLDNSTKFSRIINNKCICKDFEIKQVRVLVVSKSFNKGLSTMKVKN